VAPVRVQPGLEAGLREVIPVLPEPPPLRPLALEGVDEVRWVPRGFIVAFSIAFRCFAIPLWKRRGLDLLLEVRGALRQGAQPEEVPPPGPACVSFSFLSFPFPSFPFLSFLSFLSFPLKIAENPLKIAENPLKLAARQLQRRYAHVPLSP